MANVPFLTPTAYVPLTPTPTASSNAIEELIDYLDNVEEEDRKHASYFFCPKLEKLRKLQEQADKIFEELEKFKVEEGIPL